MECSSCRSTLSKEFKFCPSCGVQVGAECQAIAEEVEKLSPSEQKQLDPSSDNCVDSDEILLEDKAIAEEFEKLSPSEQKQLFPSSAIAEEAEKLSPSEQKQLFPSSDLVALGLLAFPTNKLAMARYLRDIRHRLQRYKNAVVRFGITGRSGVGKSSFLNMILDRNDIETGQQGDVTIKETEYHHPTNRHLTITDMPGFGTAKLPRQRFLERFDLAKFDYFFIFFDTTIMENDIWIAEVLKDVKVPFSLVRSKLDKYLKDKCDIDQKTAISNLRNPLQQTMRECEVLNGTKLFLISCKKGYHEIGDINKLIAEISAILPFGKFEALMFFLPVLSPTVINMKVKALQDRSLLLQIYWKIKKCFGISSYVNMTKEINHCIQVLGLSKEYVKSVPGLKHELMKPGGQLPPERDKCWEDISFLDKNLDLLKYDAITVYNYMTRKDL